jgi:ABC-type transporter Mla MlaB component
LLSKLFGKKPVPIPAPVAVKPKGGDAPAKQGTPIPAANETPTPALDDYAPGDEAVIFETISAEAASIVDEAAVYYANSMPDQALNSLLQYIQLHPDSKEKQPWLMLFDLHQIQNNHKAFNELSLQFVEKFEQSAPIWRSTAVVASVAPKKTDAGLKNSVSMGNHLVKGAETDKLCELVQGVGQVRISLGALSSVEQTGCKYLFECLKGCRKKSRIIQLDGVEILIELLKKQIAANGSDPTENDTWQLLFELYQWLGLENAYEDLAIEYAVTYEISPPAWEAVKPDLAAAQEKSKPVETISPPEFQDDAFLLRGIISESSQSQLSDLAAYAKDRKDVRINMANVPRVDFVAVGNVIGTLINLGQGGKTVSILETNELILALFHMMNVEEFAKLVRKKAH